MELTSCTCSFELPMAHVSLIGIPSLNLSPMTEKRTLKEWSDSAREEHTPKSRKSEAEVSISCPICMWEKRLSVLGTRSASPAILRVDLQKHLRDAHSDRLLDESQ